ncbi:interleukin-12 receptor subunit beta-1 isoform X2 [Clupea harengus]|uniref:Interleukin-12 receptor subunit beta-1 isoform X2 n=1 Tax=Clupea harengus TaxID=7950 RepID=A0A8M1KCZ6_CLUHA|nr:interleukin-12 receptor subunit beta-1 isoform X2 [Clupea harengus]
MRSRSSGLLFLEWDKPEDRRGSDYEVRYKETGHPSSTWSCKNFTTEDDKPDSLNMSVAREAAYKLQARRRAKEVRYAEWSGWSSPIYMPLQLDTPPVVTWNVTPNKKQNARVLKVSWKPPPVEASVGGLHYNLSLYNWPCAKHPHTLSTNSTEFKITITLSVVRVNIYASNNLGSSPSQNITVPAVQHLRNCSKEMEVDKMKKKELKRICWEWYRLEDGNTQPEPAEVKNATKKKEAHITKIADMEDFVRYYYFAHMRTKSKKRPHTRYSCPVYKNESTPLVAPQNLTVVDVTSTSVKACWQPIPVPLQRGFLTHYRLCLSGVCENVPESKTCKTFRDLTPAFEYNITVAGETSMGSGPRRMVKIWTSLEDGTGQTGTQREWIIIGSLLGLSVLAACPFILIRLRNKLPAVPKPVFQLSAKYSLSSQEVQPPKEEVYVVTLEHMQKTPEALRFTPEEGRTLLQEEQVGSECEEEAKEEKQDDVMSVTNECDVTLNPDYKRQTLGIPEVTETMERTLGENEGDVTSPVYKNGLFFDVNLRVM